MSVLTSGVERKTEEDKAVHATNRCEVAGATDGIMYISVVAWGAPWASARVRNYRARVLLRSEHRGVYVKSRRPQGQTNQPGSEWTTRA